MAVKTDGDFMNYNNIFIQTLRTNKEQQKVNF